MKKSKKNMSLVLLFFPLFSPTIFSMIPKPHTLPPIQNSQKKKKKKPLVKTDSNENLLKAAWSGDSVRFEKLLRQASTNINYQDGETGKTVAHIAAENGDPRSLEIIFQNNSKKFDLWIQDYNGKTAFHYALENKKNDPEVVKIFFRQKGFSALIEAYYEKFITSLENGSVNLTVEIAGILEDFYKHTNIKYIYNELKESDASYIKLIYHVITNGYYDVLYFMLESKLIVPDVLFYDSNSPNPATSGSGLLHVAIRKNFPNLVKLLLKYKADPNLETDEIPQSPLHVAAENNRLPIIKILMKHGANKHQIDTLGRTAFHVAAEHGHLEIVEYFWFYHGLNELIHKHPRTQVTMKIVLGMLSDSYGYLPESEKNRSKKILSYLNKRAPDPTAPAQSLESKYQTRTHRKRSSRRPPTPKANLQHLRKYR
ncbi:ankyrin repeat domain-containing protein [Candidatus Dependentiae bacterium]|nr:ankyrin repeat domain-containing protein [Candidatus Dependentiae bacterium]